MKKALLGVLVAGALAAVPASATADPLACVWPGGDPICVNDPRDVIPYLITGPEPCVVDIGYCAPGGHCTVNVGYCAPGGNCAVNVGYCDDTDLPVGL